MAPSLNYGQQAYEGLKAFRSPGDAQIQIFRPDKNAARMQRSAACASMPPVPTDLFLQACRAAVSLNAEFVPPHETGAAMYVRPQIYGYSAQLGLSPCDEYSFCVYVVPTGVYHGTHPVKALVLDDFDRAAPNGTGSYKVGGNYAPVMRWTDKARDMGYNITLHLDSVNHEEVDEFSTSAFIGAKGEGNDVTLVVPDSKAVIDSVTCESVQEIAKSFGWKVEKRPVSLLLIQYTLDEVTDDLVQIKYYEFPEFNEVMAAGTAAALVPIRSITRKMDPSSPKSLAAKIQQHERLSLQDGEETVTYLPASREEPGPVCVKLLTQLKGIQLGKVEDPFGWCFKVSKEDGMTVLGEGEQNGEEPSVDQMD
jgi:branched-chain amino acid aminotransferase